MFSYVAIACLLGVAMAAPSGLGIAAIDSVSIPRYGFNYAVNDPLTGDNKAQSEIRDGGVVKGSYSLSEPDGTVRIVDYAADPIRGFNANVRRVGPAVHPQVVAVKQAAIPVAVGATSLVGLGGLGLGTIGNVGLGGLGLGGIKNYGLGGLGLGSIGNVGIGNLGGLGLGIGNIGGLGIGNIGGIGIGPGIALGRGDLGLGGLGWKN